MKAKNYQAVIRQPNVTFERHKLLNNKREREREREIWREPRNIWRVAGRNGEIKRNIEGKKDTLAKKNYESQKLPSGHQTTKCDI